MNIQKDLKLKLKINLLTNMDSKIFGIVTTEEATLDANDLIFFNYKNLFLVVIFKLILFVEIFR